MESRTSFLRFGCLLDVDGSILLEHWFPKWVPRNLRVPSRIFGVPRAKFSWNPTFLGFHDSIVADEKIVKCGEDQNFNLFAKFQSYKWLQQLAYLSDIFNKLNDLNSSLQGRYVDVFTTIENIASMKGKVELWAELVPESRLDFFPLSRTIWTRIILNSTRV